MKSQIIAFLIAAAVLLGLIWLTQAHAQECWVSVGDDLLTKRCEHLDGCAAQANDHVVCGHRELTAGQARPDCWSCTPVPTVTP